MERALNLHPFYDKGDILKNDQAFFPFTFQKHQKKQKERMKKTKEKEYCTQNQHKSTQWFEIDQNCLIFIMNASEAS